MTRTCRRKRLHLNLKVSLQNHFIALQTEKESPVTSVETLELSKAVCITTRATKKRQQVVVVGDCHLGGTEAPTCLKHSCKCISD